MSTTIPSCQSKDNVSSPPLTPHNGTFHFPEDLTPGILVRLPVKSLLRFRCVSKPWCSLIDSRKFVKEHLHRNVESPDSNIIISAGQQGSKLYLADVDCSSNTTAVEISDPLKTHLSGAEFIGSCNGLVCLWKNNDLILWNPSTRKFKKLPEPTNMHVAQWRHMSSVIGFGYDHVNDDYKVMRISDDLTLGIQVAVYSLKRNSWTRAETIKDEIRLKAKYAMYANGTLYWLAIKDSCIIVAFDLGVERHRVLPYPAGVKKTGRNVDGLVVFDRCLCLMDHYPGYRTDVWMKNENGLENSWSRLLSVAQPGILGSYIVVEPVAFSKTRDEILLVVDESKFMWYDRKRNEVRNAKIDVFPAPFEMLVYTESLVQLGCGFKTPRKQTVKQSEEKKQQKNMSGFLSKGFKLKL